MLTVPAHQFARLRWWIALLLVRLLGLIKLPVFIGQICGAHVRLLCPLSVSIKVAIVSTYDVMCSGGGSAKKKIQRKSFHSTARCPVSSSVCNRVQDDAKKRSRSSQVQALIGLGREQKESRESWSNLSYLFGCLERL